MEMDSSFIAWIITTALMLITGFISLVRRIDGNKKEQELRDMEIKGDLKLINNTLKGFNLMITSQIEAVRETQLENKTKIAELEKKVSQWEKV